MSRGDGGASRIRHDLVEALIKERGMGAYTHALARMAEYENDEFIVDMWRKIIDDLDEHFKRGEEQ